MGRKKITEKVNPLIIAKVNNEGKGSVDLVGTQDELGGIILQIIQWYYDNKCTDQVLTDDFVEELVKIFDIELSWIENESKLFS